MSFNVMTPSTTVFFICRMHDLLERGDGGESEQAEQLCRSDAEQNSGQLTQVMGIEMM